jgi:cytochrome c-type biogenesis protein CcsB
MDVNLLFAAVVAYFMSSAVAAVDLLTPRAGFKSAAIRFLWAGLVAHIGAIVSRTLAAGYPPITNSSESMSVVGLVIVAGFLALELRRPVGTLSVVISPIAFALTLGGYVFDPGVGQLPPNLQSALLPVHVLLAVLGNGLFTLAFAVSLAYLVQERRLKTKRLHWRLRLPPLEMLDRLNYRFLTWGLSLFTLAIVSGIVWAHLVWGRFWLGEPRLLWAGCTWAVYALVFQARVTAGMRGRRAARLTILGFATLVFSLIGGSVFAPGRHGGTFG